MMMEYRSGENVTLGYEVRVPCRCECLSASFCSFILTQILELLCCIHCSFICTDFLRVYIDGCLFEAVGSTDYPNTHEPKLTLIGKSTTHNLHYAGIKLDQFMFWRRVLTAAEAMSLYITDR